MPPPIATSFKAHEFVMLVKFDAIKVERTGKRTNPFLGTIEEVEVSDARPDPIGTRIIANYHVVEQFKGGADVPQKIILEEGVCSIASITLDHYYLIFTNNGYTNVYCGESRPLSPWQQEHLDLVNRLRDLQNDA